MCYFVSDHRLAKYLLLLNIFTYRESFIQVILIHSDPVSPVPHKVSDNYLRYNTVQQLKFTVKHIYWLICLSVTCNRYLKFIWQIAYQELYQKIVKTFVNVLSIP